MRHINTAVIGQGHVLRMEFEKFVSFKITDCIWPEGSLNLERELGKG